MKQNYFLLTLILLGYHSISAQTDINFDVNSTAGTGWIGFMNVSNLPAPYGDGVYQFGSGWGTADLIAISNGTENTVTLKPNRIGDPDTYWQSGNLMGNKLMDASFYLEDDSLAGTAFSFNGGVESNTLNSTGLDVPIVYYAFVKVFAADYSSFTEFTYDLGVGDFTIALTAGDSAAGNHIQYGFNMTGPNIGLDPSFDAQYDALGSIVIGENAALSVDEFSTASFNAYPNPAKDKWTVSSNSTINTIDVFDVLGKQVMSIKANSQQVELNAATLNAGLYIARIQGDAGSKTIKLIKI